MTKGIEMKPAPESVTDKREPHPLNDTIVTIANPTARYRAGYKFGSLQILVWAVAGDKVYGYNGKYGECFGDLWAVQS
jgi:hypothetical protein